MLSFSSDAGLMFRLAQLSCHSTDLGAAAGAVTQPCQSPVRSVFSPAVFKYTGATPSPALEALSQGPQGSGSPFGER